MTITPHIQTTGRSRLVLVAAALAAALGLLTADVLHGSSSSPSGTTAIALPMPAGGCNGGC